MPGTHEVLTTLLARKRASDLQGWSIYDSGMLEIELMEPVTIQERAITSPIWVSPDNHERTPSDNTP